MKDLKDLEPKLTVDTLHFECPACDSGHHIMVALNKPGISNDGIFWKSTGDTIETISLAPSIDATKSGLCKFHGWITNGKVIW